MDINLRNRIAAMSVQYLQFSLDYLIDSYVKCGIHNIEFWAGEPHYYRMDYLTRFEAANRLKSIKARFTDNGIKVIMFTPETLNYPYSFSHPDQAVRNRTVEFFDMCCQDALELDCHRIFINTGCGLRDIKREESWKRVVDSLVRLCDVGKKYNIDFVLEQLQPYESNLVTTLAEMKQVIKDVGQPNLKICLDVVAMEVAGENMKDWFQELGEDIEHIHLADQNHQILGTGDYPIKTYLGYLGLVNFDGYISLEINDSIYWMDPHRSLYQSIDYLNNYFAEA